MINYVREHMTGRVDKMEDQVSQYVLYRIYVREGGSRDGGRDENMYYNYVREGGRSNFGRSSSEYMVNGYDLRSKTTGPHETHIGQMS
jgi:hypothetical protein